MDEHRHIAFFTATILNWKPLLKPDKYKQIILDALQFLVRTDKITLYGFVIMPNHIHLLWKMKPDSELVEIQKKLLGFTAKKIIKNLKENHPEVLAEFKSTQKDRKYHIWERRPLTVYCYNREVAEQKLRYIHLNHLSGKWNLAALPEEYAYSSAGFYYLNSTEFDFITHYYD